MSNTQALKTEIMRVLQNEHYTPEMLLPLLEPISICTNDQVFRTEIDNIVEIITIDRTDDNKFAMDDLLAMSKDIAALRSLFTCLSLIVKAVPDTQLTVNDTFLFKVLVYLFMVALPQNTGIVFSMENHAVILDLLCQMFIFIESTGILSEIYDRVMKLFRKCPLFACLYTKSGEAVLEKNLPKEKLELIVSMRKIHGKTDMLAQIKAEIKNQLASAEF